ncbi:flagellar protein FhlB-like protein [Tepidicaulis marinus]|uniref:Flagellar protein FhlB-like protein n=1 Tax=Tepidicaulis marinus TaxID=1333998 RepID=A0A081BB44_9HYPH|nr:hypothetical protein [Tepidicaulis marinus]GAK45262.1 flagellar protein FhlB-like protein [Tepidicaulis marinus]
MRQSSPHEPDTGSLPGGAPSLADEIVQLARECGKDVTAETDLAQLLSEMAEGMQINVPVLLALSQIATPLFKYEMAQERRTPEPE